VEETFDFVVIGSGGGAMAAAMVMRSLGKSVVILEKTDLVGGTTARSGGVLWIPNNRFMGQAGIADSAEKANTYLDAVIGDDPTALGATPARRRAYVDQSAKMLEFLISQGLKFRRIPSWPDYYDELPGSSVPGRCVVSQLFDINQLGEWKSKLRPTFVDAPANIDEGMLAPWVKKSNAARWALLKIVGRTIAGKITGKHLATAGNALQGQMLHAVLKAGADVRTEFAVKEIVVTNERVTGVIATKDGADRKINAALGVLINAGGFAHNQKMRDQHMPGTSAAWTSAAPGDTGEMIEEAVRLGAATAQMDAAVNAQIAVPPGPPTPIKAVMQGDAAKPHTIVVDQSGVRYMNETGSYVDFCLSMLERNKTTPAAPSWLVIDSQFTSKYSLLGKVGPEKLEPLVQAGFLKRADTLDALAAQCGMDAAKLKASVERFNGFARAGKDDDFHRGANAYQQWQGDPYHLPSKSLGTVEQGPFYAVQLFPGDVSTYGGVVTDEYARVLRADGAPIEGLYATGVSTASALGRREPAAGGSVGPSFVFGYVAAKHAANASNQISSRRARRASTRPQLGA
jgi:3-oxosteroid 1-dehydrogenase